MTNQPTIILVCLMLALLAAACGPRDKSYSKQWLSDINQPVPQVDCETDYLTGETTCSTPLRPLDVSEADVLIIGAAFAKIDNIPSMWVVFTSDEWQWLQTDTIYFIIDGQRFEGTLFPIDRYVLDTGQAKEKYGVLGAKTPEIFDALKMAHTVVFRASDDSFTFSIELLADYKKLTQQQ